MAFLKLHHWVSFLAACLMGVLTNTLGDEISWSSAKEVLSILKAERGAFVTDNITHVRGHRGQDQPVVWEVTSRISDGERVFVISNGAIVEDTIYSSGGGLRIDMRRFKIDSSEVFKLANRAAEKANVGFDSLDYELLAEPRENMPLWIIFLRDFKGRDVGRVEVSGVTSRVVRSHWFDPRDSSRPPIGSDDSDRKYVLRSYKPKLPADEETARRGAQVSTLARETGRRFKRGFLKVGKGINSLFANQSAVSSDRSRYKLPGVSRQKPR